MSNFSVAMYGSEGETMLDAEYMMIDDIVEREPATTMAKTIRAFNAMQTALGQPFAKNISLSVDGKPTERLRWQDI